MCAETKRLAREASRDSRLFVRTNQQPHPVGLGGTASTENATSPAPTPLVDVGAVAALSLPTNLPNSVLTPASNSQRNTNSTPFRYASNDAPD